MIRSLAHCIRIELLMAIRRGDGMFGIAFYFAFCTVFAVALGGDPEELERLAPLLLWVGVIFASFFGLDRQFGAQGLSGPLDRYRLASLPPPLIIAVKVAAAWITSIAPLIIAAAFLGLVVAVDRASLAQTIIAIAVGSLALALLGTLIALVLCLAGQRPVLLPLLALPLTVPVLIFGLAASHHGERQPTALAFLIAYALFLLAIVPLLGTILLNADDD